MPFARTRGRRGAGAAHHHGGLPRAPARPKHGGGLHIARQRLGRECRPTPRGARGPRHPGRTPPSRSPPSGRAVRHPRQRLLHRPRGRQDGNVPRCHEPCERHPFQEIDGALPGHVGAVPRDFFGQDRERRTQRTVARVPMTVARNTGTVALQSRVVSMEKWWPHKGAPGGTQERVHAHGGPQRRLMAGHQRRQGRAQSAAHPNKGASTPPDTPDASDRTQMTNVTAKRAKAKVTPCCPHPAPGWSDSPQPPPGATRSPSRSPEPASMRRGWAGGGTNRPGD